MATFTICRKFVDVCGRDAELLFNTLYYFVHRGPLRIAIDDAHSMINDYHAIAEKQQWISNWLSALTYRNGDAYEVVTVSGNLSDEVLYLEVCSNLASEDRKLVCHSKQDYQGLDVDAAEVTLIDRAEAPDQISAQSGQVGKTTIINADVVTFGNKSPGTKGDKSEISQQ